MATAFVVTAIGEVTPDMSVPLFSAVESALTINSLEPGKLKPQHLTNILSELQNQLMNLKGVGTPNADDIDLACTYLNANLTAHVKDLPSKNG